ncbi:MAG: nicotinate-nucleotide--dimethylbenzimidazole phosphoribosyltransferase [Candidatus Thiosymbion ectosymbiont of Robbea hypermnestra]|nr:nicotinate-nucleotide--dimethylbenzimidazole phosphoribosyltransferase [Candidatus Thiosymbion ectosymbiont of Robbea hypermnestra]
MSWLAKPARPLDEAARRAAVARQTRLTKPPGALGRLEEIAIALAAMQGEVCPTVDPARVLVFAGDHGVADAGVSAYPQSVTAQMVTNMASGGAAISVLAKTLDLDLELIVLGTVGKLDEASLPPSVHLIGIGPSTRDFSREPAMSNAELDTCLAAGRAAVERAVADQDCRLIVGGEMGIGNSTAAAALACVLLDRPAAELAGPGTGLDATGIARKAELIERARHLHRTASDTPREALRRVAGFEIAALTGAYLRATQLGIPVLVDGFIATSAALAATRILPEARDWMLFAHSSREPGHAVLLAALDAEPLLDLGLRLGEGSGAASALPLLRLACTLHREMASFAEAGIDGALS